MLQTIGFFHMAEFYSVGGWNSWKDFLLSKLISIIAKNFFENRLISPTRSKFKS